MKKKLNYLILLLVLAVFFISHISAVTLSNTTITSSGLNSTLEIFTFPITFDKLDIFNNAITFTNLTYIHPSSCDLQQSDYSIYNYTIANTTTTLPFIPCVGGGGNGIPTPINITLHSINITTDEEWLFDVKHFVYVIPLDIDNNIVELTNLSLKIIENITYTIGEINLLSNGEYRSDFIITKTDITNFSIEVIAVQNSKTIKKIYTIKIREGYTLEKIDQKVKNIMQRLSDIFEKNKILIMIIIIIVLSFFITIIILKILAMKERALKRKEVKKNLNKGSTALEY